MFNVRKFRIHGDNIVECHRTLSIIAEAYGVEPVLTDSPVFAPVYALLAGETFYYYQLLSGHDRWGGDLRNILLENGAILREGADSYLTEIIDGKEKILLGIEYCSALLPEIMPGREMAGDWLVFYPVFRIFIMPKSGESNWMKIVNRKLHDFPILLFRFHIYHCLKFAEHCVCRSIGSIILLLMSFI